MDSSTIVIYLLIAVEEYAIFIIVELYILQQQLLFMNEMLVSILYLQVLPIEDQGKLTAVGVEPAAFETCLGCYAFFVTPSGKVETSSHLVLETEDRSERNEKQDLALDFSIDVLVELKLAMLRLTGLYSQ